MITTDPPSTVPPEPTAAAPAGPAGPDPLLPADLKGWVRAVWGVVRRSWPRLVALQLIVVLATLIVAPSVVRVIEPRLGAGWPSFAVTVALSSLLAMLTFGAGIRVAVLDAAGRTEDLTASLRFGLSRMFPPLGRLFAGAGLAYLLIVIGYSALARLVVTWALDGAVSATAVLVQAVLQLPAALVTFGVIVVTYAGLRHRGNPEVTAQTLADELDRPGPSRRRWVAAAVLAGLGLIAVVVLDRVAAGSADVAPVANPRLAGSPIPVRQYPRSIALSQDGRLAYLVIDGVAGKPATVSVVDLETRAEVAAIPVGVDPWKVVPMPDGRSAYVSNRGGAGQGSSVSVIDIGAKSVTTTIPVGVGAFGLALTPDGGKLYVTDKGTDDKPGRQVMVIDTRTNGVVATVPVGDAPEGVTISPDGRRAYVSAFGTDAAPGTTVTVIDTATDTVVSTITTGRRPRSASLSPDGSRLFVTLGGPDGAPGSSVAVVDSSTGEGAATIPVGLDPVDVKTTPDGRYVYVVNNGTKIAYGNSVTVIDTSTDRPLATVPVGALPIAVAITADGRRAYVANSQGSSISVIDTGIR